MRKTETAVDESLKSQMKGVVEKSDSVSYMLEMTEDSSEIVTNIIRRAESLRSTTREVNVPKKKRSKALSISSIDSSLKRNGSIDNEFRPKNLSTPNATSNTFDYDRQAEFSPKNSPMVSPIHSYPVNKIVKLNQDDFSTDSIELSSEDCEIIEITKSFDKSEKNVEMVTSTSSNSSSSSKGSHFDIESDVFSNLDNEQHLNELDDDTESSVHENGSSIRSFSREEEPLTSVYADLEPNGKEHSITVNDENAENPFLGATKASVEIPKISGGEAMIGLSDDEEIEKIKKTLY